jgi:alkaline phosphatase D
VADVNLEHASRWNVIAQRVMVAPLGRRPAQARFMDNGTDTVRAKRLLEFIRDAKPSNPIVLTGNIHSNW